MWKVLHWFVHPTVPKNMFKVEFSNLDNIEFLCDMTLKINHKRL